MSQQKFQILFYILFFFFLWVIIFFYCLQYQVFWNQRFYQKIQLSQLGKLEKWNGRVEIFLWAKKKIYFTKSKIKWIEKQNNIFPTKITQLNINKFLINYCCCSFFFFLIFDFVWGNKKSIFMKIYLKSGASFLTVTDAKEKERKIQNRINKKIFIFFF